MPPWIDFRELRAKLDFEKVLSHYGVQINRNGDQHLGFCPLPDHNARTSSPSFSANLKKGIFQCFGCKTTGNILDFAIRMEKLNPQNGHNLRDVALKLKQLFVDGDGVSARKPNRTSEKVKPKTGQQDFFPARKEPTINPPLDFELKDLDSKHPCFKDWKLSEETVGHFGLGFCSRGLLKGRVAIPLRDDRRQLLGYCGLLADESRPSEDNPTHRFPENREREGVRIEFNRGLFLYNGNAVVEPVPDLIVTDWFSSVWWLHQARFKNTVALMGSDCTERQAELILEKTHLDGCVWIMPANDHSGIRCASSIFNLVGIQRKVRWLKGIHGDNATRYEPEELRKMLPQGECEPPAAARSRHSIKARLMSKEINVRQAIVELANSFPTLRSFNLNAARWEASDLDRAAKRLSPGGFRAVQFVLRVWEGRQEWYCGEFNVVEALDIWDSKHREAFLSWAKDPWWV